MNSSTIVRGKAVIATWTPARLSFHWSRPLILSGYPHGSKALYRMGGQSLEGRREMRMLMWPRPWPVWHVIVSTSRCWAIRWEVWSILPWWPLLPIHHNLRALIDQDLRSCKSTKAQEELEEPKREGTKMQNNRRPRQQSRRRGPIPVIGSSHSHTISKVRIGWCACLPPCPVIY